METTLKNPVSRQRTRRRAGKPWSGADISRLVVMAERQMPADRIARRLQRTESAVRAEAIRRRLKLSPTEKRPYGGMVPAAAGPARERSATPRRGTRDRKNDHSRGTETLF